MLFTKFGIAQTSTPSREYAFSVPCLLRDWEFDMLGLTDGSSYGTRHSGDKQHPWMYIVIRSTVWPNVVFNAIDPECGDRPRLTRLSISLSVPVKSTL